MGFFDLFRRPKTEQEEYYENYDKQYASNTASNTISNTSYDTAFNGNYNTTQGFSLTVEDVFTITGRGTVIVGRIASGSIKVGDTVTLKRTNGSTQQVTIAAIEMFRKVLNTAKEGDNVGLLLRGLTKADIGPGDILIK